MASIRRSIVLLAGTNNVGTRPGGDAKVADITRGLPGIVDLCPAEGAGGDDHPDRHLSRATTTWPSCRRSSAINANLARLADGKQVRYLNINDKLADKDGQLFDGMMNADKLHPALKGYQVWADALKPIFTEIARPPAATDHAPPPTGDPSATRPGRGRASSPTSATWLPPR